MILVFLVGLWVLVGSILLFARQFLALLSLEVEAQDNQQLEHVKNY
jgi:hypothetical protein